MVVLVLWVACGLLGFAVAADVQKKRGRGPWAMSPWAWAAICGLTSLLGLIVLLIAGATTKHTVPSAGQFPYGAVPPSGFGVPGSYPPVPAGRWAADPTGRHQYRWWDGASWTAHVSTNGTTAMDPI